MTFEIPEGDEEVNGFDFLNPQDQEVSGGQPTQNGINPQDYVDTTNMSGEQLSRSGQVDLSLEATLEGGFASGTSFVKKNIDRSEAGIKKWMQAQERKQMEASPYYDKESGIDYTSPLTALKTSPFFRDIKNPWESLTEDGLAAHTVRNIAKGNFRKPLDEIIQTGKDAATADYAQIWNTAKEHPGKFAAEFINSIFADPELLLAPAGLGGKIVEKVGKYGRAAKAVGTAAETGLVAGAMAAPISAMAQLDEKGYINPYQVAKEMQINAGAGAVLGGVLGLAGHEVSGKFGQLEPGATPQDMLTTAKFNMQEGDDIMTALNKAMETHGVPPEKAADLTKGFDEAVQANPDLEADFAKMRQDLSSQIPEDIPAAPTESPDLETYIKNFKEEQQIKAAHAEDYQTLSDSLFKEADAGENFKTPEITPALKQTGIMDPELAKYIALTGAGAAAGGYWADDRAQGATIGAALALGGAIALKAGHRLVGDLKASLTDPVEAIFGKDQKTWEGAKKSWDEKIAAKETEIPKQDLTEFHSSTEPLEIKKKAEEWYKSTQRDKAIAAHVDDILSRHEGIVASTGLASDRLSHAIKQLVPDVARREELIHAVQEGRVPELQGNERTAAELFQKEMAEAGDFAQNLGVLDDLIDDGSYVTQLWEDEQKAQSYYSAVSGKSRFAEDRLIPSYKEGMALGLKPKTLDLAEIAGIYGKSVGKSYANKLLLEELKGGKFYNDLPMMGKPGEVPLDYVQIDHPQLQDLLVHPELAPSLSHVFYSNNIPAYMKAMTAASSVAKRSLFGFSGFHIKSLLDVTAGLAAGTGSLKPFSKIPSMYKMIKEGKAGDFADQMMQAGLKIDPHSGIDMDNGVFKNVINSIEAGIKRVPGGKLLAFPITAIKKLDSGMQFILWEYLHPAMKLAAANTMYEKALLKQANILAKDPTAKLPSNQELQREIATATNDLFGGLNWRKVSDDVQTKWLHDLSASVTNPVGLRAARVALLAPDWTVATARTGYKGIKSTIKGVIPGTKLSASEDMYRRYFLGSAMLYATIADGLNLHFSGHHFWQNDDPTYVDLGDGRKLQLSKHFMEPFHWMQHPGQAVINKMGYLPKEGLEQAMGKEYLTANGGPAMENPSIPGRLVHAAKGMLPITVQQTSPKSAALGFIGLPVYGKTKQEKDLEKRKRDLKRRMKVRKLKGNQ